MGEPAATGHMTFTGDGSRWLVPLHPAIHVPEVYFFPRMASDRISVNMNAAQALLFQFKASRKDKELLNKARHYLDISQQLDNNNEKYQKLESIYSELS